MTSQSTLLGAAGEHHVMSELLIRGYIPALAPDGVPNVDIVVTNIEGNQLCTVQVKSRQKKGTDGGWSMREKHEKLKSPSLFYCFVDFGSIPNDTEITYIVPSSVVADTLANMHQRWLAQPGKNGQRRNDNPLRRFLPSYQKLYNDEEECPFSNGWLDTYKEAWHRLPLTKI